MRQTHLRGPTLLIGLTLILLMAGSTTPVIGSYDYTYTPSDDVWAENNHPDMNFDHIPDLEVLDGSWEREAFLGFSIPTHDWSDASLRLYLQAFWDGTESEPKYGSGTSMSVGVDVYEGMGWSEETVTWNSIHGAPLPYGTLQHGMSQVVSKSQEDTWVEFDLDGFTGGAYTVRMYSTTSDRKVRCNFGSREAQSGPELVLSSETPLSGGGDDSPEPATWVLLVATAAFGALRRRRD